MPHRMMKAMDKIHAKQLIQRRSKERSNRGQVVITCKRSQFNHYSGQKYSDFSPKDLASSGWKHAKSKGDHLTIQPIHRNPALLSADGSPQMESFESLNLHKELIEGLKKLNIVKPTNIQALTIPVLKNGQNVLCAAETGSGKTLAFLLPMIDRIHRQRQIFGPTQFPNRPMGVVLTPSRELADQIYSVARDLSLHTPFTADVKCGGRRTQKLLREGVEFPLDLLITTPGVFSKLLTNKIYDLSRLSMIVLDEADSLLDDSFNQLTCRIIQKLKVTSEKPDLNLTGDSADYNGMQIALVGATIPRSLEEILGEVVPMDTIKTVTTQHLHRIMPHVAQKFMRVGPSQRPECLLSTLKSNAERKIPTIVFCNKTSSVHFLGHFLTSNNVENITLHADMPQAVREGRYDKFQNGDFDVLVCTDIASRGLDTIRARHVINYEFPLFISDYIHRVGRVGRVGSNGSCFAASYVCYKWDVDLLWQIEAVVRRNSEFHNVNANIKRKLVGVNKQKLFKEETASQPNNLLKESRNERSCLD